MATTKLRSTTVWIAALMAAGAVISGCSKEKHAQAPASAASVASTPSEVAGQAPTAVSSAVASQVMAEQAAVAREVEKQPLIAPIEGPVKERPSFMSDMEWQMVKGVANQQPSPDQALTKLVNSVRYNKQYDTWEALPKTADPAKRQALAEQLLADLPARLLNGEMDLKGAQKSQAALLVDAEPDPKKRLKRAEAEAKRLVEPPPEKSASDAVTH